MSDQPAQIENPQPEFDTSAAIAEISSDLFGQGSEEDNSQQSEGGEAPEGRGSVEPPLTQEETSTEENSAEVQELGAPSTWTKEALQEWAQVPERVKQEILKREDDMMKGMEQYKTAANLGQQYDTVVEPYRALLAAENVNPVELFQNFAANHYLLSRGTPEQKVQLAANMLQHYQIDLNALLTQFSRSPTPADPKIQNLERQVQTLTQTLTSQQQAAQEKAEAAAMADIEQFAADPAHPFFNELIGDIMKLMEAGVATTLSDAYDKAVYANPVTRQKEIDRLTAEKTSAKAQEEAARKTKIAQSTAATVKANSHHRDGTVPVGSMDDTLNQTLAQIQSRA